MTTLGRWLIVVILVLAVVGVGLVWHAELVTQPMMEPIRQIVERSDEYYRLAVIATRTAEE